jgi:hypothetical protein
MRALAAPGSRQRQEDRGDGWLEEADLAEVAHAWDEAARAMARVTAHRARS